MISQQKNQTLPHTCTSSRNSNGNPRASRNQVKFCRFLLLYINKKKLQPPPPPKNVQNIIKYTPHPGKNNFSFYIQLLLFFLSFSFIRFTSCTSSTFVRARSPPSPLRIFLLDCFHTSVLHTNTHLPSSLHQQPKP